MVSRSMLGYIGLALGLSLAPARAEILIGLAGPMTGPNAWMGEQTQTGLEIAVADLNERGGVLGETINVVAVDDFCRGDQAIAAAEKLVAEGVVFVAGHNCSGAAIPASAVYDRAGILMIANSATNPRLTERGLRHVFRVVGRDDTQGAMAAAYMSEHWRDGRIAILHDGEVYGAGLADEARRRLAAEGVDAVLYEAIGAHGADYADVVARLEAADVDLVYYGGYAPEAALILRQARDAGLDLQLVAGDGIQSEDFWLIAGPAAEGTLMTNFPEARTRPAAAPVVERFRRAGIEPFHVTLQSYATIQVWAEAVEEAGTFETDTVATVLRTHEFDTVLGTIGFDAKGDVTGYETFVWYVWQGGAYLPLEESKATD